MKIKRFIGGLLESNGYIISADGNSKDCFIIDPGYNPKRFLKYIKENDLDLKGVILTHHHSDHVGGVDKIKNELDCPVLMHRCDIDQYGKPVDVYLEDGDVLELGDGPGEKLVIIHTPGHTKGGICIMSEKSKVCFTGDTIFNVDLGRTDLEDGSDAEMAASMVNIVNQWSNEITIYPGHGDPATMKTVRKINREFIDIVG